MKINFFEEFPHEKENIRKLQLVDFSSTIYIAAHSLAEFRKIEKEIIKINNKIDFAYWPLLKKSYWISPFSYTNELKILYQDLQKNNKKLKILIDLEFPLLKPNLILRNFISFKQNKKIIKNIFRDAERFNCQIMTAEYPFWNNKMQKIAEILGVSYPQDKFPHTKIPMYYTSMIKSSYLKNKMVLSIQKNKIKKNKIQVGLGTISKGVLTYEPILSSQKLDRDLKEMKKIGINEVVIYRLGGLNEKYLNVIKKYLDKNQTS